MKITKNVAKLAVTLFAALLIFVFTFNTLAWLASKLYSGDLGFSAGVMDGNVLEVAKAVNTGDGTPTEEDRQYYSLTDGIINGDSVPTANGDGFTITLDQMSFGIIDNVALAKPENIIYLRLTVPKKNGSTVKMKLYYAPDEDGYFTDMYKNEYAADGTTVENQTKITADETLPDGVTRILDSFHNIESAEVANDCYINFSVALSNDEIAATELSTLTYLGTDGTEATKVKNNYYKLNSFTESSDGITLVNDDFASAGENYYVYIKVEPNLDTFAYSIEYISGIMPCFVYFKVKADFEIIETR